MSAVLGKEIVRGRGTEGRLGMALLHLAGQGSKEEEA